MELRAHRCAATKPRPQSLPQWLIAVLFWIVFRSYLSIVASLRVTYISAPRRPHLSCLGAVGMRQGAPGLFCDLLMLSRGPGGQRHGSEGKSACH